MNVRRIAGRVVAAGILCAGLLPLPAAAQLGDTGSGPTPLGREGAVWQTDHQLAQEQIKELEAALQVLDLDGWKEEALAWVVMEWADEDGERFLSVPEAFRVGDVDAGSKAEVDGWDLEWQPHWEIRFPKKAPRDLTLVLTDDHATRVTCPFRPVVEAEGETYLGVFVLEGVVHCMPRLEG